MRNVEVKARCADLDRIRETVRAVGAAPRGTLHQVDTYFRVSAGRLKLRRMERSELIFYQRPDDKGPKPSEYEVASVDEPERMRATLAAALGIRLTVEKRRELWIYDNVRVHLDTVTDLGTFLELEAVVDPAHPEDACRATLHRLLEAMGIGPDQLVNESYVDLLSLPPQVRSARGR